MSVRHFPLVAATLAGALLSGAPSLAAERSKAARADFQRQHPCPATGKASGACPGYVVDHRVPLCAGGADAPSNMAWQTVAEAKVKNREEVKMCRSRKP